MVDLATAFVSIVPSLKGAQRQIQSQIAGVDLTPAGSELGKQLSGSIGKSMDLKTIGAKFKDVGGRIEGVGRKLTNSITKPAVIAAGAVGGLVAGLGFKRLVGLDTAQAKLRGLGYAAEDVAAISGQVSEALVGGMMTLAEGVDVAAGAMAAGVKQGDELKRHIQLVDAAAIGMNTSVDETNQIFNRIMNSTGSWRRELDMIEFRMPGFSNAFAEHMGISYDEMMKLVSEGKIGFDEFSAAMEHFAGDMATEYAKSWAGMWQNTKAYLGMIGEEILSGVFQDGKVELANFVDWLSSPEVMAKAREFGERLREGFELVRAKIRELIDAWNELDPKTQDWIKKAAIAAVAAGPFLVVLGKAVTLIGGLATGLGTVVGWLGSSGLGGAFLRILGPIGLAIGAFKLLWDNSDELQEAVGRLWDTLKEAWEKIWPSLEPVLAALLDLFVAIIPLVADLAVAFVEFLLPKIEEFADAAIPILDDVAGALEWLTSALDTDEWDGAWGTMLSTTQKVGGEIQTTTTFMTKVMRGDWRGAIDFLRTKAEEDLPKVEGRIARWGDNINRTVERVRAWWSEKWGNISTNTQTKFDEIRAGAEEKFNSMVDFVRSIPGRIQDFFSNSWNWLKQAGRNVIDGFKAGLEEKFGEVKASLNRLTSWLPSWKGPASVDRVILRDAGQMVIGGFIDGMEAQYQSARRSLRDFTGALAPSVSAEHGVGSYGSGRSLSSDDVSVLRDALFEAVVAGFGEVSGRQVMLSRGGGG